MRVLLRPLQTAKRALISRWPLDKHIATLPQPARNLSYSSGFFLLAFNWDSAVLPPDSKLKGLRLPSPIFETARPQTRNLARTINGLTTIQRSLPPGVVCSPYARLPLNYNC